MTTFSRSVLVEPVVTEVRDKYGEDELLIDLEPGSAEVVPTVDIGTDKTEAGQLVDVESDKENTASTTEIPKADSGLSSPGSAVEGTSDVK